MVSLIQSAVLKNLLILSATFAIYLLSTIESLGNPQIPIRLCNIPMFTYLCFKTSQLVRNKIPNTKKINGVASL